MPHPRSHSLPVSSNPFTTFRNEIRNADFARRLNHFNWISFRLENFDFDTQATVDGNAPLLFPTFAGRTPIIVAAYHWQTPMRP